MKSLWTKVKNITGKQYFVLTIVGLIVLFVGTYVLDFLIGDFFVYILVWWAGYLFFTLLLVVYGIFALFRTPSLKERVWVWIGLAINLYVTYSFIFVGPGY